MLKRFGPPQPIPPSAPAPKPTPVAEETPKLEAQATPQAETPAAPREIGNKLIVGPNIKLKGSEITDCDILLVEGRVEASMNSRDMRIAEGGIFVGVAEIDTAEVRGEFEGELIARKRLVIHATGKVSGKIRYGALTVEEGGTVSGDVGSLGAASKTSSPSGEATAESAKLEPVRPAHASFGRNAAHTR
jgi:cytoskeletal protein CcmA (bactofilin family)